jgi:ribonuclease-3
VFIQIYNTFFSDDKELVKYLRGVIGFTPANIRVYKQAFRHRSIDTDSKSNNERLELLGDSILDAVVCEYLLKKYPYKDEGFITELRSKMVNRRQLNELGEKLGLVRFLEYNRKSMNEYSKDLAGNTFEALIGAVYCDMGFERTKKFLLKRIITSMLDVDNIEATEYDFKSKMYHYSQREGKNIEFKLHKESQRGRRSYFVIHLMLNGTFLAAGEGFSKKQAEQQAAMNGLRALDENTQTNGS